jgi:hypothetical protein
VTDGPYLFIDNDGRRSRREIGSRFADADPRYEPWLRVHAPGTHGPFESRFAVDEEGRVFETFYRERPQTPAHPFSP